MKTKKQIEKEIKNLVYDYKQELDPIGFFKDTIEALLWVLNSKDSFDDLVQDKGVTE